MNWKNRLTNYNFWISIVSAVLLILQAFKFEFDIVSINEIATAVLGLLVVIGIISDPTKSSTKQVNSSVSQKTDSQSKEEEQIPCDKEDEVDGVFNKDDFKVLIEKISADLNSTNAEKVANEVPERENLEIEEIKEDKEIENEIQDAEVNVTETVKENSEIIEEKIIEVCEEAVEVEVNSLNQIIEVLNEENQETLNEENLNQVEEINKNEEEKIECYNIVNN